ncbi:hypothetical protein DH2020_041423 [Rehmannia glutinosa]|uniref:Myb/SANT-like domain-containing protein n=1 Tax=Rehmannia glutinosa TaxID=99300 RepID=A0ABR0UR73_REHGL
MGDSQGKSRNGYNSWTVQESTLLLELLVDAANRGWRDSSGLISKQTVETKILPVLNEKLGCQKTYTMYQSRWKHFKQKYQKYAELMRFSSGFGWDSINKKFTATDEVWNNYFESHPTHKNLRTDIFPDYEDLRIVVGNATATGKNSIRLGDESDARTYGVEENTHASIEDYTFDEFHEAYIPIQQTQSNNAPHYESYTFSPPIVETGREAPPVNNGPKKRTRNEYEESSKSTNIVSRAHFQVKIANGMDSITEIATDIRGMLRLMEKREKDREKCEMEKKESEDNNNIWNAIKETLNLDDRTRYKAPAFIHK